MRKMDDIVEEIYSTNKLPRRISIVTDVIRELEEAGFEYGGENEDSKLYEYTMLGDILKIVIEINTTATLGNEYFIHIHTYKGWAFSPWEELDSLLFHALISKKNFDECMEAIENHITKMIFDAIKTK